MENELDLGELATECAEMRVELRHLKEAIDLMSQTIGRASERINTLETRLAVNDVNTSRNSNWLQWVATGIGTVLIGYIAVKVGLK